MPRPIRYLPYYTGGGAALTVTITAPANGATVTSAVITVNWSVSAGTQQDYRVIVYSDSGLANIVYDSGTIISATQAHAIPAGALNTGQTYYMTVQVATTGGQVATSASSSFITSFAASVNVTGVTASEVGGCTGDPTELPGIRVRWSQVVTGVGETFVQYDIRRTGPGDATWTRIATVDVVSTTSYVDYTAAAGVQYRYDVVWVASHVSGTLISSPVSYALGQVKFDFAFLHAVGDESTYVRYHQHAAEIELVQDVELVTVWGRRAPTARIGELEYHTISLPGLEHPLSNRDQWEELRAVLAAQREDSRVLCLRLGRAREKFFCAVTSAGKSQEQKSYRASIALREIDYSEAV